MIDPMHPSRLEKKANIDGQSRLHGSAVRNYAEEVDRPDAACAAPLSSSTPICSPHANAH